MRYRRNFFGLLAAVSILFVIGGTQYFATSPMLRSNVASDPLVGIMASGILHSLVLCIGLPTFLISTLLYWRNGVGLKNEERHQEMLEAIRQGAYEKPKRG